MKLLTLLALSLITVNISAADVSQSRFMERLGLDETVTAASTDCDTKRNEGKMIEVLPGRGPASEYDVLTSQQN